MRIAFAAGTILIATAVLVSGCTADPAGSRSVITANGSEPQNPLIPAETTEIGGARVVDNIFAGLVTYAPDGSIENDVADTIEANPGQTIFTVTVRSGLRFSDGSPVDANAFVNAWDWAADSAHEAPAQPYFSDIKGYVADDPVTPDVERSSLVESGGLVVVTEHSFEIHLAAAHADYPQRLGVRAFFPLPPAFFDDTEAFGEHPIGNGPYMLDGAEDWQHNERIDLAVNPAYDGPRLPVNDGVSLIFYKDSETAYVDVLAGFLDVLDDIPDSALPTRDDELGSGSIDQPGASLESLVIPATLPHFTKKESALRRAAISMAIDRDAINAGTFGGLRLTAHDFTAPVVEGYDTQLPGSEILTYNDAEAKLRWAAADEIKPWEGTFVISYAPESGQRAAAEVIASSIATVLGIDAAAVPNPSAEDLAASIADHTIATAFLSEHTAAYPGPLTFLEQFGTKSPNNVSGFASKPYDAQLKLASLAATSDAGDTAFEDAQRVLLVTLPAIPLWNSAVRAGSGDSVDNLALAWNAVPQYFSVTTTR